MGFSWDEWGEWGDMGRNNNALTKALQNYYEKLSIVKCD